MGKKSTESRRICLEMLLEYESTKKLNVIVKSTLDKYDYLDSRDKSFIKYLVEGCVRRKLTLDYVIDQFAKTKNGRIKQIVRLILRMGIFQILFMDSVPDQASCNESVNLAIDKGLSGLKGFVNGVLRNVSRNKTDIKWPSDKLEYMSIWYSMPMWLVKRLVKQYGNDSARAILEGSIKPGRVSIRVNECLDDTTKASIVERLQANGNNPVKHEYVEFAYYVENLDGLYNLPGFANGDITVQDVSSQLVCHLAGIKAGDYVIDVCAAPGGKSMHASVLTGDAGTVDARDLSEKKTELIKENAERLKCGNVCIKEWDATCLDESVLEKADVVICDLPCSGLGVMGRKSDIRYNITEENILELAALQRRILDNAVKYVKPGGKLVFSTCTLTKEENIDNANYIRDNLNFEVETIDIASDIVGITKDGYLQLCQGINDSDGFFISIFRKPVR